MQNIDNDMDNLFSKAAEDYMPGIGDSEWDAVRSRLSGTTVAVAPAEKKKRNIFWVWLLLLAAIIAPLWIFDSIYIRSKENETAKIPVQREDIQHNKRATEQKQEINERLVKTNAGKSTSAVEEIPEKNEDKFSTKASSATGFSPVTAIGRKTVENDEKQPGTFAGQSAPRLPEAITNTITNSNITAESKAMIVPVPQATGASPKSATAPDSATTATTASSSNQIIATGKTKFYIGLMLGPEISQVRQQGFAKSGIHAGLLAGYRLSKKTTFESGVEFKKKYYYSDGKYFRMKATPGAPAMKVINLDGSCNVLEVPLRLSYQLWQWKHASLFALGGISSDLLMRERNNYRLSVNGVPQTMLSRYNTIKLHVAATADVGIGFEHTLGRSSRLRVQPYVQIPLQGMGVGDMQVMSAGINIAIIKPFR